MIIRMGEKKQTGAVDTDCSRKCEPAVLSHRLQFTWSLILLAVYSFTRFPVVRHRGASEMWCFPISSTQHVRLKQTSYDACRNIWVTNPSTMSPPIPGTLSWILGLLVFCFRIHKLLKTHNYSWSIVSFSYITSFCILLPVCFVTDVFLVSWICSLVLVSTLIVFSGFWLPVCFNDFAFCLSAHGSDSDSLTICLFVCLCNLTFHRSGHFSFNYRKILALLSVTTSVWRCRRYRFPASGFVLSRRNLQRHLHSGFRARQ